MPHATGDNEPEDELELLRLAGSSTGAAGYGEPDDEADFRRALGDNLNLDDIAPGEEQERAEDAIDYEDIGSDDLGDLDDDEDTALPTTESKHGATEDDELGDLFGGGAEDDHDDLFNEIDEEGDLFQAATRVKKEPDADDDSPLPDSPQATHTFRQIQEAAEQRDEEEEDPMGRMQAFLFDQARLKQQKRERVNLGEDFEEQDEPPPAATTDEEVFTILFPDFEPEQPPIFGSLLPQKRAFFPTQAPLKQPKPVQITKVSLDIEQDQEKSFRIPGQATSNFAAWQAEAQAKGLVLTTNLAEEQAKGEDDIEFASLEDPEDDIGGVKWQDLVALCQSWDVPDDVSSDGLVEIEPEVQAMDEMDALFGAIGAENEWQIDRPAKKQKTHHHAIQPMYSMHAVNAMVDNPESAVSKLARRLQLDLNDPRILVDVEKPLGKSAKGRMSSTFKRDAVGGLTKDLARRYNISNDEAYEALKANQTNKVRSNLSNVEIQHAMPAIKLQYPFYKTRLAPKEARSFHRPVLQPGTGIAHFGKTAFVKRKHLKGRETQDIFRRAADLSIADNSSIMLLEYSEEYPAMLSNFGMSSKLINYYRRKDAEDTSRPKLEIGETQVLMPEDKSPFSIFGNVDKGQSLPTLLNAMYRAPVFQHKPNGRDFVVARTHTHTDGTEYHFRNVENLHVVGQEFPLVEVPGTHSRKVTDAAKKRLRMLSYRMYRRHGRVKNEMILPHLPGTDIAQNRSKMREFMDYDKDRGWVPRRGEALPEEPEIRSMIKPEDVCLIYSTQVGDRQLQDAGYNKDEDEVDVEEEDEDDSNNLDKQLAPWNTTKNFLNACQGKAMLLLHGDGDPSGRGEAFSMIKTSMKGGFRAEGESVEEKISRSKGKSANAGHSYNVARQQQAYNDSIRRIWDAQQKSLSSSIEHEDIDMGGVEDRPEQPSARDRASAAFGRSRADDEVSFLSKASTSADAGKILRITREYTDQYGRQKKEEEVIKDPRVIREYARRRKQIEISELSFDKMEKTGDSDYDREQARLLKAELARLERNKDRRLGREKAKGIAPLGGAASPEPGTPGAGSPGVDAATPAEGTKGRKNTGVATQRKCANCGQVGHIKTNKKLCPMLNGSIKMETSHNGFGASTSSGFGGSGGFGGAGSPPPASDAFGSLS